MKSRDFCYWLQGYFELAPPSGGLTQEQADTVAKHLALVFKHEIDPSAGSAEHQTELNEIHSPGAQPVTPESVAAAIKEAVDKLPKPSGGYGREPVMRC